MNCTDMGVESIFSLNSRHESVKPFNDVINLDVIPSSPNLKRVTVCAFFTFLRFHTQGSHLSLKASESPVDCVSAHGRPSSHFKLFVQNKGRVGNKKVKGSAFVDLSFFPGVREQWSESECDSSNPLITKSS